MFIKYNKSRCNKKYTNNFANNLLYNRKKAEEGKTFSAFLFHVEHSV